MKAVLFMTIVLLVGAISAQDEFRSGRKITPRTPRAAFAACQENGKSHCAEPCSKVLYKCTGNGKGIEIDCGGTSLPFCQESVPGAATCKNVPATDCTSEDPVSDFECMEEGVFPDPRDCHQYFDCYDDNGELKADPYVCDDQYVFDPSDTKKTKEYCRLTRNRFCTTAACTGTPKNILMTYQFYPKSKGQFVASCRSGAKSPLVTHCKAGFLPDLNTLPVECKLQCTRANKAEYSGDTRKYWECVFNGRGWEAKEKSCFRGDIFDPKIKRCVTGPTTIATTTVSTTTVPTSTVPTTTVPTTTVLITTVPTTVTPTDLDVLGCFAPAFDDETLVERVDLKTWFGDITVTAQSLNNELQLCNDLPKDDPPTDLQKKDILACNAALKVSVTDALDRIYKALLPIDPALAAKLREYSAKCFPV